MKQITKETEIRRELSFWFWLIDRKKGGGLSRWCNRWLVLHFLVGSALTFLVKANLPEMVRTMMLPFAAALFGLTFAWVATANNFVSSKEFRTVMHGSRFGVRGAINYLQMVVYVVLLCAVYWGIVGLGPYPELPGTNPAQINLVVKFIGFSLTSFAVVECASSVSLTRNAMIAHELVSVVDERTSARESHEAKVQEIIEQNQSKI